MPIEQTYRAKMFKLALLPFVGTAVAGVAGGLLVNFVAPGESFWLLFPALLIVFAVGMGAVLPWWRGLDDVQKTGQMVSWWWGGQIGGVIVLMALVATTGKRSEYSLGGLAVFLGEVMAFVIAWLIWRYRLRGPVE